jgi:hypothetical protein
MQLHLSPKSLEDLRNLIGEKGLKTQIKKDDDGWFVRLNRVCELTLKTGKIVGMLPPEVFDGMHPIKDEDGKVVGYPPLSEPIGNGSDGVAKIEVYPYTIPHTDGKKGYALRWHSLRIDTLVPFNKASFDEAMDNGVRGLPEQPKQAAW